MITLRHLALWLVALAACGSDSTTTAKLGDAVVLSVGQTAELESASLRVGVSAVPEDSRCPEGVVCIWQGLAVVSVWVEKQSSGRQELLLATANTAGHSSRAEYLSYQVEL